MKTNIVMNAQLKTRVVATGIVLVTVVSALIIGLSVGKLDIGKNTLKIAFSIVSAFSLVRRASWARWVVGILSMLSVAMTFFIFLDWQAFQRSLLSWAGVWMALMTIFYIWTSYTLIFDRDVIAYFKNRPVKPTKQQAEEIHLSNRESTNEAHEKG